MDEEILQALRSVNDPELGINIVDLGLVYRALRKGDAIEVAFTLTSPSCPMGEMLIEEVRQALGREFPDSRSIQVDLVWDPPWSPENVNEAALRRLG